MELYIIDDGRTNTMDDDTRLSSGNAGTDWLQDAPWRSAHGTQCEPAVPSLALEELLLLLLGVAAFTTTTFGTIDRLPQEFHQISDRTLDGLTDVLERLVESDHAHVSGWDVDYSSGVMHFSLGNAGTYVINKQPPNKQIWLSSPFSGPKRFDYDKEQGCWFYGREGRELMSLLGKEVDEVLGDTTFSDLLRASSLLPPP